MRNKRANICAGNARSTAQRQPASTALIVGFLLVAQGCGENPVEPPADPSAAPPLQQVQPAAAESLALPLRLAFMSGHVAAGIALYRAGAAEMAAPHLLHPVSETHQAERAGIAALGFDSALFEAVSKALEDERPATDIEPQLRAAEANLAAVAERAGGDPAAIIRFLMATIDEEYAIAVPADQVTDIGEYQDAWGFAQVALGRTERLSEATREAVRAELLTLLALWPEAPLASNPPAPLTTVVRHTSQVSRLLQTAD